MQEDRSNLTSTDECGSLTYTQAMHNSSRVTLPLSDRMMRSFSSLCCQECALNNQNQPIRYTNSNNPDNGRNNNGSNDNNNENDETIESFQVAAAAENEKEQRHNGTDDDKDLMILQLQRKKSEVSPLVIQPMMSFPSNRNAERIVSEYISACRFYGCGNRINAGVLTTIRFQLPALKVSESFHDADMLALGEVLFRHANHNLRYITRLDFSTSSKDGKNPAAKFFGFRSHGAFTLSKVLQSSKYIHEVMLSRNHIGPYGASAVFLAASTSSSLQVLKMRQCRVGERGAMAFAEHVCRSKVCGLQEVDLSANRIGFRGSKAIERELAQRDHAVEEAAKHIHVDLEGNLVYQEVMNGVTHGLGIILAILGSILLSNKVRDKSAAHVWSCTVYNTSLIVLYTSSTLYHSFFLLQNTKYVFEVFDKCAIYILIAGSYTPICQIVFGYSRLWSVYMIAFIWICAAGGILVEAFAPTWERKMYFSLAMYLGMGWTAMLGMQDMLEVLPSGALSLLLLGGVSYTVGVPFFVRNNNLDHSIWHLFVLMASTFHWCCIYCYVADF